MKYFFLVILLVSIPAVASAQQHGSLKIITLNIWSGLDYEGTFKMGEYEPDTIREKRFAVLISGLKELNPDIIFLQEVNPVSCISSRIADSLNYDEIHQVCLAGIKIGPFGLPSNLKEGNTILARKEFNMKESDAVKLSGSFGLFGDALSFHFDEAIFALTAKININGAELLLVNTHLYSLSDAEGRQRRTEEINELCDYFDENSDIPIILGGDLNAGPGSEEIKLLTEGAGLYDCFNANTGPVKYSWDPINNLNVKYSLNSQQKDLFAVREAKYDQIPRRVDYIFVDKKLTSNSVKNSRMVFDKPAQGLFASDHYGFMAEIDISSLHPVQTEDTKWEGLPLISYDTDFGLGGGLKSFFLNQLGFKESIDLTAYYSTKGERWYRFVFSVPDFELRQQTTYPFAVDLVADYDKMQSSYFGTGNNTKFSDRETYDLEPFELRLQFSKGFTSSFVWQAGLKFRYAKNYHYSRGGKISQLGGINSSVSRTTGLFTNLRYDTRNSFINPSDGIILQGDYEYIPNVSFNNTHFESAALTLQYYYKLFFPKTIFASRFIIQGRFGKNIPIQNLLNIGGNSSLRGFVQNRLTDNITAVFNSELRFPVYWRFGGIIGIDAGNVWNKTNKLSLKDWKVNPAAGLRFYFDTFVIRLDMGFSSESTGFFLNFGHLF